MSRTDVLPTRRHLRLRYVVAGIVCSAAILAVALITLWIARAGSAGLLSVDGVGGAAVAIFLFAIIVGLTLGVPIAAIILRFWPTSTLAAIEGLALFAMTVGLLSVPPTSGLTGWLQGTAMAAAFGAISIGLGALFQRLHRRQADGRERSA